MRHCAAILEEITEIRDISTLIPQAELGTVAEGQIRAGDLHRQERSEARSVRGMPKSQRPKPEFAGRQWPDKSHSAHNREEVPDQNGVPPVKRQTNRRPPLNDDNTPPHNGAVRDVHKEAVMSQG